MLKYCLVRFIEDGILYVVSSKKLKSINDKLVWAPYKKMGLYEAIPLEFNNDRTMLENKKNAIKKADSQKKGTVIVITS